MGEGWQFAIDVDEIAEEDVIPALVGGLEIAVFRVKGQFYATQDRCTHGGAALSEGVVVDDIIECPLHQGRFCVRTGQPRGGPVSEPLRTYPTKVEDGRVLVRIGRSTPGHSTTRAQAHPTDSSSGARGK